MTTYVPSLFRSNRVLEAKQSMASQSLYLFASNIEIDANTENCDWISKTFLNNVVFGKKITVGTTNNLIPVVRNIPWKSGTVYDMYSDKKDLSRLNHYIIVPPSDVGGGDYHLYQCLSNNNEAPSTSAPTYSISQPNQRYKTIDKYEWLHMATIKEQDFKKYAGFNVVPLLSAYLTQSPFTGISSITIDNPSNDGYTETKGLTLSVDSSTNSITISGNSLSSECFGETSVKNIDDYYNGMLFVSTSSSGTSVYKTILDYTYNALSGTATLRLDSVSGISVNDLYSILPRVVISGDGSGAVAVPSIENGVITGITMVNSGSGYTKASVSLVSSSMESNTTTTLSVATPPTGGHRSNVYRELGCNQLMIFSEFKFSDNVVLPTTGSYSAIGIVSSPTITGNPTIFDNRVKVVLNTQHIMPIGSFVTQKDSNGNVIFRGTVHEIDGTSVYLTNTSHDDVSRNSVDHTRPMFDQNNVQLDVNSVSDSKYTSNTGNLMYLKSIEPITRDAESNEQFKIILTF